jgi:hypothetical protein
MCVVVELLMVNSDVAGLKIAARSEQKLLRVHHINLQVKARENQRKETK